MKLSHSKLSCILNNPAEYYLRYKVGLSTKVKKTALSIGSAVHWGIEHDTEDLTGYYAQDFKYNNNYTQEQLLAESMVHGYLKNKKVIFDSLLFDEKSNEKAELLDEKHEIFLSTNLESSIETSGNEFIGIIDLLLRTNKGFILVDYKTSSSEPDWDSYLDQIYRYIMLLKSNYPNIPVYKIAIINIRKTGIRIKKGENNESFLRRLKMEYDINDDSLVCWHIYEPEKLNASYISSYINNLKIMCDTAANIEKNQLYYINYANAINQYGKTDFYDIFYKTDGAFTLYNISDKIYDEDEGTFVDIRPCRQIDMEVIDITRVMNKYEKFKQFVMDNLTYSSNKEKLFEKINKSYLADNELLEIYWLTLNKELSQM